MAPAATLPADNLSIPSLSWETFGNIVDGKVVSTKETRHNINPANKKPNHPVPLSTKDDLDAAVASARKAFKTWKEVPWDDRKAACKAWAKAITERSDEFAQYLTKEQGKPLSMARIELHVTADLIDKYSDVELKDETVVQDSERTIVARHVPLGVAGLIVPWNYPLILLVGKVVPALLTGNTIVAKPSPFTPYTGLKLLELAQNFFPPGVVNAVSGDDNLGPWMTSHPGIDKISFTGSTATGKRVMESCAKTLKRVTLELGGKDPAIILPDVDVKLVASQIAVYSFINAGQLCMATKRIFVHKSIMQEFVAAMVEVTKNLKVGDGMRPDVFMGPIQNEMQYERVKGFFDDVKKEGHEVVLGGQVVESAGYFVEPTIVVEPADKSRIMIEEPFGPIVPVVSWETEEEVIRRANDSDMGLGASVWSNDWEKAIRIGKQLEAGNVWINEHFLTNPAAPFSGHKGSGMGAEYGKAGLASFCNMQSIYIKKAAKAMF